MKKALTLLLQKAIARLFCLFLTVLSLSFMCFSVGCGGVEKTALTEETFKDYLKIDYSFTDALSAKKLGGNFFYINPVLKMKVSPVNEESEYVYGGTVEVQVDYYFDEIIKSSDFITTNRSQKQSTVKISLSENGSGETTVVSGYTRYVEKYYYARLVYYKITNINAYIIDKSENK